MRLYLAIALTLVACDRRDAPIDGRAGDAGADAAVDAAFDAGLDAAAGCDGPCAGIGEACSSSDVDLDAGARDCAPGLVCCYPCGVANCVDRCIEPCTPTGGGPNVTRTHAKNSGSGSSAALRHVSVTWAGKSFSAIHRR